MTPSERRQTADSLLTNEDAESAAVDPAVTASGQTSVK